MIYKALKKIYKTTNEELQKNYHLICKQLMDIYNKYHIKNQILLNEYHDTRLNNIGVITLDNNNNHVLTHFSWSKKVPKEFNYEYLM